MRKLTDWLPASGDLLRRARQTLAGALMATAGFSPSSAAAASAPAPIHPDPSWQPVIENRARKIGKVLLRLPGYSGALLAQHRSHSSHSSHRSHSSHSSHYSGSSGIVRSAPVAPPGPVVPVAPVASSTTLPLVESPDAAGFQSAITRPPVVGVVRELDVIGWKVTIVDQTPLEARIDFFYDTATKFISVTGESEKLLGGRPLPLRVGQPVSIRWAPHPSNPSKKMVLTILERK